MRAGSPPWAGSRGENLHIFAHSALRKNMLQILKTFAKSPSNFSFLPSGSGRCCVVFGCYRGHNYARLWKQFVCWNAGGRKGEGKGAILLISLKLQLLKVPLPPLSVFALSLPLSPSGSLAHVQCDRDLHPIGLMVSDFGLRQCHLRQEKSKVKVCFSWLLNDIWTRNVSHLVCSLCVGCRLCCFEPLVTGGAEH